MAYPGRQTVASIAADAQKAAAIVRKDASKQRPLTRKQRTAVEAMVFQGLHRPQAALAAGMSDEALRVALTKPWVLAYVNEQQEVLRTSLRPRALTKIGHLLDKAESERVQLDAAKYLDGMDRGAHQVGAQVNVQINNSLKVETPGYVIRLRKRDDEGGAQIDHLAQHDDNALISNEEVPDDE